MVAIILMSGAKYACKLYYISNDWDHICLQSWSHKELKMLAIVENRPETKFFMIASIFDPYRKKLQSYIVCFGFEIASLLGLF